MMARAVAAAVALAVAGCGDNRDQGVPIFDWSDRAVGALRLDGLRPDDGSVDALIDERLEDGDVAMLYGHYRGNGHGTTNDTLGAVFARAKRDGLPFVTFAELATESAHAGISLSFDDDDYDAWRELRELLVANGAVATFFVTRYPYASADDKAFLHELAADGNDIEAHSIDHVNALEFLRDHGGSRNPAAIDQFVREQVMPSFAVLRADGYAPVAYAHPFGATTDALDAAILAQPGVALVRRITTR